MSNCRSVGMTIAAIALGAFVMVAPVGAKGIIKGATKGAAVGHFVGHGHAKAGAMVGAVHGHHHAMKKAKAK
jgi:type IV secretory pathway TrbL component